ncbi:MAG: oligosaccharide flippase family protein [Planctomycetes bacterium]|nr:oligosaccharide flippase family protein [Planctomycetota bacterium]
MDKLLAARVRELLRTRFVRDLSFAQAAQIAGLAFAFATSILLVRHLGEDGYRDYALGIALFLLLRIPCDPGLDGTVIPRLAEAASARDRRAAGHAVAYFTILDLAGALVLPVLAYFAAAPVARWLGYAPVVGDLARILSLVGVAELAFRLATVASQGLREFKSYAILSTASQVARFLLVLSGVLAGCWLTGMSWIYVGGAAAGSFCGTLAWRALARRNADRMPGLLESLGTWKEVPFARHLRSGLAIWVAKNVPTLYELYPILLLGVFHPGDVTRYKIVFGLVSLPAVLLGPISQNTTVKLASEYGRRDRAAFERAFYKITLGSLGVSAALTLAFALASPLLLLAYGREYLTSLPLLLVMAIHPLTAGLGVAVAPFFRTIDRMGRLNALSTPIATVLLAAGFFLIREHGAWGAAILLVALRLALRAAGFLAAVRVLRSGKAIPAA